MSKHSWPVQRLHRFVVASGRGPLRRLWVLLYGVVGCAAVAGYVRSDRQVTIYLRNGATRPEFLPGLSDIDLVIIAISSARAQRIRGNRDQVARRLPWIRPILDQPLVLSSADLGALAGTSVFTYGLDSSDPGKDRGLYFGADASPDVRRVAVLPGLAPEPRGWRRVAGRERRVTQPPRDEQAERVAAWLELSNWWRITFQICLDPGAPNAAAKCVKLVADTAATWLWLEHREHVAGRTDALRRALARARGEERALSRALALQEELTRMPAAPLAGLLPAVVRFSARIVDLLDTAAADVSATQVRLVGGPDTTQDGRALPLVDWVSLAWPMRANEEFSVRAGDASDPTVIGAAARTWRPGSYPAVRTGGLLIMPARGMQPTRLRAIKCQTTDPVVFAVADGNDVAAFPALAGWSALDTARRATAEHRSWLRTGFGPVADAEGLTRPGLEFELLLVAARAGLFHDSLNAGDPSLTLTPSATITQLLKRSPRAGLDPAELTGVHDEVRNHRRPLPQGLAAELRVAVLGLPAYAAVRRR